jgi:hypothetical protein
MDDLSSSAKDFSRTANVVRDAFGYVSVVGFAIITAYALLKLTPVWQKNLDEEVNRRSGAVTP